MDRRKFLVQCSQSMIKASTMSTLFFSGGLILAPSAHSKEKTSNAPNTPATQDTLFKRSEWQTLTAIQEHLFPAKNGAPGASQFNAKAWLYQFLTFPKINPEVLKIYRQQIKRIQDLSQQQFKNTFIKLSEPEKEKVLRLLEQNRQSQRWLAEILNNIIEALLTDPVYGGNTRGIGWKWLGHQHGFPRPKSHQKYNLL